MKSEGASSPHTSRARALGEREQSAGRERYCSQGLGLQGVGEPDWEELMADTGGQGPLASRKVLEGSRRFLVLLSFCGTLFYMLTLLCWLSPGL